MGSKFRLNFGQISGKFGQSLGKVRVDFGKSAGQSSEPNFEQSLFKVQAELARQSSGEVWAEVRAELWAKFGQSSGQVRPELRAKFGWRGDLGTFMPKVGPKSLVAKILG